MNFNEHSNLEGLHAFLGASKYSWLNYDDDKLDEAFLRANAKAKGTRLHELAAQLIEMRVPLPKTGQTLNMYVNDAIGYRMTPEQPLFYSKHCFGTADAICFRKNLLRIHDLKTGFTPASMHQLEIYTALFCLEYDVNPNDIDIELRIYQMDEVLYHDPERDYILFIMDKIIYFDKRLDELEREEE